METKINGELTQFEQLVIDANGNQLITGLNGRQYLLDHDGDAALLNDPIIAHPLLGTLNYCQVTTITTIYQKQNHAYLYMEA